MNGHMKPGQYNTIAHAIMILLPSLSQSAWNARFYFGHQKPCMDNNNIILDGLEGDTRIYLLLRELLTILPESKTRVILLASRAIYTCIPRKEPSNIIIIIHIVLCVSSYYLTIVGDCRLPFCHRTKAKACGM